MKKIVINSLLFILFINFVNSKESSIQFNGILESIFDSRQAKKYTDDPDYGEFTWGWFNQANLRFKSIIGDNLSFGFAININILSGNYTDMYKSYYTKEALSLGLSYINVFGKIIPTGQLTSNNFFSIPFYYKSTYIGSFELERLYFKAGNYYFDIEAGLIRISKGYGFAFSPNDFLNPRDPLREGRPEGKMAIVSSFYPVDMWKIQLFAVAPDDPLEKKGWGFKFGTSTSFSINKLNFQVLYTLFMPDIEYNKDPLDVDPNLPESTSNDFSHIAGFSMKADIKVGLFIDITYRFDHKSFSSGQYYGKDFKGFEGLEAAAGIDYTIPFGNGNVYLLLEYMFYGSGMIDWDKKNFNDLYTSDWEDKNPYERVTIFNTEKKQLNFLRHDYIFGMIKIKINDFFLIGNSYMFGCDDQSGIFSTFFDIDPLQSLSINITAVFPFDWRILDSSREAGEFGSTYMGFYQDYKITVKIKF